MTRTAVTLLAVTVVTLADGVHAVDLPNTRPPVLDALASASGQDVVPLLEFQLRLMHKRVPSAGLLGIFRQAYRVPLEKLLERPQDYWNWSRGAEPIRIATDGILKAQAWTLSYRPATRQDQERNPPGVFTQGVGTSQDIELTSSDTRLPNGTAGQSIWLYSDTGARVRVMIAFRNDTIRKCQDSAKPAFPPAREYCFFQSPEAFKLLGRRVRLDGHIDAGSIVNLKPEVGDRPLFYVEGIQILDP